MDALDAIDNRKSVRKYNSKLVSKEIIERIINAGRKAPSAVNVQPWEFIAVTGLNIRKKLADVADYGKFIAESPLCIVVFCKDTKYYLEDGCAAVENILIAATALGLGTCWIAGDKKSYAETVREILRVPEGYKLIALISVGYSDDDGRPRTKRELKEVLHYETF
ncbi:MAG: nitroreductase family protein [Candidatus Bathyarchaeota archaeon]|nr:nitroreductase family protein [Candidatus Bathyarchaeota archaeon]